MSLRTQALRAAVRANVPRASRSFSLLARQAPKAAVAAASRMGVSISLDISQHVFAHCSLSRSFSS